MRLSEKGLVDRGSVGGREPGSRSRYQGKTRRVLAQAYAHWASASLASLWRGLIVKGRVGNGGSRLPRTETWGQVAALL